MSPVRTMYEAAVEEAAGNQLVCRIHGNGFLYHMVRNIIGTVANVGLGIITPQRFQERLRRQRRPAASSSKKSTTASASISDPAISPRF